MPSMVRISWPSRFDREHQAGADQPIVERDRAGAAIAGGAAFLGAGERQRPAQRVEHGVIDGSQRNSIGSPLMVVVT